MNKLFAMIFISVIGLSGCSEPQNQVSEKTENVENNISSTTSQESQPTQEEVNQNLEKLSLADFINNLKPKMADVVDEHPEAAGMLAYFLNLKDIKLSDINQLESTTKGKILKDSELERGKKICVRGTIVEITADRSGGFPAYGGVIVDDEIQPYTFIAVGDTGELESQSNAKFCGIAIGKINYSNSGGGTSTAPYIVGLFDLPANK